MKIKYHITAGCYLFRKINDKWQIILIYRKWDNGREGYLPPKGHLEKDESFEQAAIRETQEETGYIDFSIIKQLGVQKLDYLWDDGIRHKKDVHYYVAILNSDNKFDKKLTKQESDTTISSDWLDLDTAKQKMLFEDDRELLIKAIDIINSL
jgi:ADP-ribose pyrophosphatase YjhB (NUDIX family)